MCHEKSNMMMKYCSRPHHRTDDGEGDCYLTRAESKANKDEREEIIFEEISYFTSTDLHIAINRDLTAGLDKPLEERNLDHLRKISLVKIRAKRRRG